MLRKYIGDKKFYKSVLALAIPIMIQNGITNLVNMLDNIMVGSVGTVEMTGVAISNQLIFVFNLCIFGAISGASIFGAQFYGKGDYKGLQYTFKFKVYICLFITVLGVLLFSIFGNTLSGLFLTGEGDAKNSAASLVYAREYMLIMLIGLLPYALSQCYSGTLRESGQAKVPMVAGIVAVFINLIFNAILIYGLFGIPKLGVKGAAIATVISRFCELFIVSFWTHKNKNINKFIIGVFDEFSIPKELVLNISAKGLPLLINETMWSAGIAIVNQTYSTRGYDVVAANNISQTFYNVFSVAFMAIGAAIAIILGQTLGAGDNQKAKEYSFKLIAFSVFMSCSVSVVFFAFSRVIPLFYNATDSVRTLATNLMRVCAITMPLEAFAHASYFTIRSGGKTFITILFDSCFVWCVTYVAALLLCEFTSLSIIYIYLICQCLNIIKCFAGYFLVAKGYWIKNIV